MTSTQIHCRKAGAAGLITLDRPAALHALTHPMIHAIAAALDSWEHDADIGCVVIEAKGGKAFCAGGDIRALYHFLQAGDFATPLQFWADEYRLNFRIKRYSKPFVALVDGLVMGGGAGISLHGSHVVAGDNFSFAMPEVGIGFFPDVGATYFLSHLPGKWGLYLAMTGARANAEVSHAVGLVTARIATSDFPAAKAALIGGDSPEVVVGRLGTRPSDLPEAGWMERAFSGASLIEVMQRLVDNDEPSAAEAARSIARKSPTSLAIAFMQIQLGRTMTLEEALQCEYRLVSRIIHHPDFAEGVRAVVIDKDNDPSWSPSSLSLVRSGDIDAMFAPLESGELELTPCAGPTDGN